MNKRLSPIGVGSAHSQLMAMGIIVGILLLARVALGAAPPETPLDCEVYETKKFGVTVGFRIGNLLLNAGPDVTIASEHGVAWHKVVQGLIARYEEVCTRYNGGLVTKEEYAQRIHEIEDLHREAQQYERQLREETRAHAREGFSELDHVFPGPGARQSRPSPSGKKPDSVARGLENLKTRIDQLTPIGKPLHPTKPCTPPDMLGSPGERC